MIRPPEQQSAIASTSAEFAAGNVVQPESPLIVAHLGGQALAVAAGFGARANEDLFPRGAPELALATATGLVLTYPFFGATVLAWPAWDRLRRSRLLRGLTPAQLVAVMVLAAGIAALSTAIVGTRFSELAFDIESLRGAPV